MTDLKVPQTIYMDEIMSDLQSRTKVKANENKIPDTVPTHIGMEKINPTSWKGKYFTEFASSSTIHGFNHLVAPRRHPVEKFLAVMFISSALIALITLSLIFWNRYQYEATVTILDHDYLTYSVTKPSIIFCPVTAINVAKFPEVFKRYDVKDTPEARAFFTFLSTAEYPSMRRVPNYDGAPPEIWIHILYDLRPQMDISYKTNDAEHWEDVVVITEKGICQTKRNFVSVYASMEYWLSNNWTVVPPPPTLPNFTNDKNRGSSESLASSYNLLRGFLAPMEVLEYGGIEHMQLVPPQSIQRETLTITETVSEEKLEDLSVHQRNCKFPTDGGLKMWPVYSYSMCKIECRYGIIKKLCGCHPHFARPLPGIPVCNIKQLQCIGNITKSLFLHALPPPQCHCIPNCNSVIFNKDAFFASELPKGSPVNTSAVTIMVNFPKVKFRRIEQYGFGDFLTAVGGAAGLFLGASVLSFIEIFYYVTMRLIVYTIRSRRRTGKDKNIAPSIIHKFPKDFHSEREISGYYMKSIFHPETNYGYPGHTKKWNY